MKLLDLFCGAGGASMGYHLAGFEVTGVDINPQPRYPFTFTRGDALTYVKEHGHEYDVIHASPPCQRYSKAQQIQGRDHPDLIAPVREALEATGRPWVIENVEGSPLHDPIMLCGSMFGIRTYRHRLFEVSRTLPQPAHPEHTARLAKMGRPVLAHQYMHIVGNFSDVQLAREIMGMPWAVRDEIREAIPVCYTRWVGEAFRGRLYAR